MSKFIKHIVLLLAILLGSLYSSASGDNAVDTLYYLPNADRMKVVHNSEGMKIILQKQNIQEIVSLPDSIYEVTDNQDPLYNEVSTIWERQHNFYIFPSHSPRRYWSIGIEGVNLGFCGALNQPEPSGLQWEKSFEISWLSFVDVKYTLHRTVFSLGLGLSWRNFKRTTSDYYLSIENNVLTWKEYGEGIKGRNSQLKLFAVQVPLLIEYSVPNTSLCIKAGPILNINSYTSVKTSFYDENGNNSSYSSNKFIAKPFTVDLYANVSICRLVGIYCRYSPLQILKGTQDINFYPFSAGISIGI